MNHTRQFFTALLVCLMFILPGFLKAQSKVTVPQKKDTTEIEIRQADYLEIIQSKKTSYNKLINNVILVQKELTLYCDSALLFKNENIARVYGHVHFEQGDSINAFGDSASYDGNTKIANLYQNVSMSDNTMTLTTEKLSYDMTAKIATYHNGGELDNGDTRLTSKSGYYLTNSNDAFFSDSVVLTNPDYSLTADTLQYNTSIERAYFHGPTYIYNEKSTVYCESGYYDTKSGIAVFNQNVKLENPPQELFADSIYYNRETGIGRAFKNIIFRDTVQNALQYSNVAEYNENTKTIVSTQGSMAGFIIEQDTLFIAGDTIRSVTDSLDKRITLVFHHVKIYKTDMQGRCDSLTYSDTDSTIRLFNSPILWSDSTQFTADTIVLYIKNQELDQIHLYSKGFIVNEDDSLIYNQVKGRNIYGYFIDEELKKIEVKGNGESIYYGTDDRGAYIGVNKMLCSDIDIYLEKRKFQKISFKTYPDSDFQPMKDISPLNFLLDDFKWEYDKRPQSKYDLMHQEIQNEDIENPIEVKSSQKDG